MTKQKILIADADEQCLNNVSSCLQKEFYNVKAVNNGEACLSAFESWHPDLILTELALPDIDGNQICRKIRSTSDVPILILSEKAEIFDKVLALEIGADDYMVKPFDTRELLARIHVAFRHCRNTAKDTPAATPAAASKIKPDSKYVEYPDLIINLTNYSVIYMGKAIEMPPKELELLYFLASSPNQVFTREQLLDHIWGYEYIGDSRTVDVHIKRIREKIKDHEKWNLSTVWGIGYKFESR